MRRWLSLAWSYRNGSIGLLIVLVVSIVAVFAPIFAPHDPFTQQITNRLLPPFFEPGGNQDFPLGTDQLGRDVASRLMYGSRWSILVGVLAVMISAGIGIPLGLVAGFYGKYVDAAVTLLVNTVISFPFIVFALAIIAFLGPGFVNLVIVLGVASWTSMARVVRTEVLSLRDNDFVLASRTLGGSSLWLLRRHLLPMVTNSILVLASLQVASMILAEAFLSFVGFGIQPPTPSWGSMLADSRVYMLSNWWLATFPGLAIFLTALGVNLLGDGLCDVMDPRTRRTRARDSRKETLQDGAVPTPDLRSAPASHRPAASGTVQTVDERGADSAVT
jgi:peptide/nickel transport system permease protein